MSVRAASFVPRKLQNLSQQPDKDAAPGTTLDVDGQKTKLAEQRQADQFEAKPVDNWFTKDPVKDGVQGVSSDRAFDELNLKKTDEPIIVAVIDSGIDVDHEDLKANVWTNTGEIPGNGIDDDGNGYVDDVHGWNFLGGHDEDGNPVNIDATQLGVTREVVRLKKLAQERPLTQEEQALFENVSAELAAERASATQSRDLRATQLEALSASFDAIATKVGVEFKNLTQKHIEDFRPATQAEAAARREILAQFKAARAGSVDRLQRIIDANNERLNTWFNENFDPRAEIIGDDPYDMDDRFYGNNDVKGPVGRHGTHVAGTIAAVRNNGKGMDGVAADVQIMALRAIPNGDEYDKDVANAVRYAVDNGARIINMSFGKKYSPEAKAVAEAFQYAADNGVIIVHAAGNDGHSNEVNSHFPHRKSHGGTEEIPGWIEVGASASNADENLPAWFSNYGKTETDVFAPGVGIYSTLPGDEYAALNGTSMATPVVAGVAALILSQHPDLTPAEVKSIIEETVRTFPGLEVLLPNDGRNEEPRMVSFEELSKTGGVVDAFNALIRAREIAEEKKAAEARQMAA